MNAEWRGALHIHVGVASCVENSMCCRL